MAKVLFVFVWLLFRNSHSFSRILHVSKNPRVSKHYGRYYEGDIEGKFAFATQQSDDASNFDCGKVSIFSSESKLVGYTNLKTKEYIGEILPVTTESYYSLVYEFSAADLPILEERLTRLKNYIGEEYFDEFEVDAYGYSFGECSDSLESDSEKFRLAARFGLGSQIAYCLQESESGACRFTCQL